MSYKVKIWFSAGELARMGKSGVEDLPKSDPGCKLRAQERGWESRQVRSKGGKKGMRTEYMPTGSELQAIQAFLRDNPGFFVRRADQPSNDKPYAAPAPARVLTTDGKRQQHVANGNGVDARMMMEMGAPTAPEFYSEVIVELIDNCLDACSKVYGERFDALKSSQQIDYAADLYNLLVRMSHAKGERLDSMRRLHVSGLVELLQVFIKLEWSKPFPPAN